jgi:ferredoxin
LLARERFPALLQVLCDRGYTLCGPTVRDGAIVYAEIGSAEDFPLGWTDKHDAGHYRLQRRSDQALFGYVVGPHSWKKYLFPPQQTVFTVRRQGPQMQVEPGGGTALKRAFIGIRSCELHALAIQDRVFAQGPYVDTGYRARREKIFTVGVNCVQAGGTCFCVSMGTGPKITEGFDLALTEVVTGARHFFTVDCGSERGSEVVAALQCPQASREDIAAAQAGSARAVAEMGRELDTQGIKELLYRNLEHPRWHDVAERCLACANCTAVCPTCFCSSVVDKADLRARQATRLRRWSSCFETEYSHIVGGSARQSTRARYRQWMTHKLASWYDQFGTSGCVGCGRCITWCPVGIDITAEAAAIRTTDRSKTA